MRPAPQATSRMVSPGARASRRSVAGSMSQVWNSLPSPMRSSHQRALASQTWRLSAACSGKSARGGLVMYYYSHAWTAERTIRSTGGSGARGGRAARRGPRAGARRDAGLSVPAGAVHRGEARPTSSGRRASRSTARRRCRSPSSSASAPTASTCSCGRRRCCAARSRPTAIRPAIRSTIRRLQGDRRRGLHAERPSRSEARCLRRRPDREDRGGAGAGRLPLHDAHHQPAEAARVGRAGALGARARRQPRALQPRAPVRGGDRASSRHRQAIAARRRREGRRPAGADVRSRQAIDLARPSDHRDGPGEDGAGDRQAGVPRAGEVPARRARSRAAAAGRARQPARARLQPGAAARRRADRAGRPRRARDVHVFRHGRRRRADRRSDLRPRHRHDLDQHRRRRSSTSPAASARPASARRSAATTSCRT